MTVSCLNLQANLFMFNKFYFFNLKICINELKLRFFFSGFRYFKFYHANLSCFCHLLDT